MRILAGLAPFLVLVLAIALEEASGWYGRHALHAADETDDEARAHDLARVARESRLAARFLVALAFAVLAHVWGARSPAAVAGLVVGVLAWAWIATVRTPVDWRSPLGLAGRALFSPLRRPARGLRYVLGLGRNVPGLAGQISSLDRVRELEEERRWLVGETPEPENVLATLHEFGASRVEDVMVRREEVVGLPAQATRSEILDAVVAHGHSRYPVYRESLDTVVGVLQVFDLLTAPEDVTAGLLARPPLLTTATKPVSALLQELQVTYNQMAVVMDEFGGTAGIVTVEDLLEELVGEIEDEHDEVEVPFRRLEPGVYLVDGDTRIEDLNEALELDLEEGEYDTVAGLVLERLERIPRPGERVREDGVWVEVMTAEPHRVNAVKITVVEPEPRADER